MIADPNIDRYFEVFLAKRIVKSAAAIDDEVRAKTMHEPNSPSGSTEASSGKGHSELSKQDMWQ